MCEPANGASVFGLQLVIVLQSLDAADGVLEVGVGEGLHATGTPVPFKLKEEGAKVDNKVVMGGIKGSLKVDGTTGCVIGAR